MQIREHKMMIRKLMIEKCGLIIVRKSLKGVLTPIR